VGLAGKLEALQEAPLLLLYKVERVFASTAVHFVANVPRPGPQNSTAHKDTTDKRH